ncbi:MAG: glycoside hydrolase family 99-like domain-containing protein [Armatimonadetes bacterium]|nr:glycoside hydrolase family 99-like domain-containing protein [Armatimonadota bacterium]
MVPYPPGPNYRLDPRNEAAHGPGWSEWELVKRAEPRFPGHRQPRVPAWGYDDEADPACMARRIDAAADHGVDVFLFDWYWYDDGPYLERGLERGFLGAANNHRLKFAVHFANHTWTNIHPAKLHSPAPVQYPGEITRETFDTIVEHVVQRYFRHPSYWLIDGCPYFSFYELTKLVASFGSVAATRRALDGFRAATRAAGFPELHLNAVVWGRPVLPGESGAADPVKLVTDLGFDSFTSYVWIHHVGLPEFPETDYGYVQGEYLKYWQRVEREFPIPYHPNVSMGWDSSPRTVQSDRYLNVGYPFMATIGGNTPERFRDALAETQRRLSGRPARDRILTINAWNEWTEGSYLEPDTETGMAYLEAIRDVFG